MANELEVNASGLQAAAASSEATARAALAGAELGGLSASRPSSAGVAAVNAALTAARGRQSSRIAGQAGDMSASGARYDTTDGNESDAITTVSV
ncbi:hypothetical protein ACRCUN_29970 [Mycobacterium sp. LTG2003]